MKRSLWRKAGIGTAIVFILAVAGLVLAVFPADALLNLMREQIQFAFQSIQDSKPPADEASLPLFQQPINMSIRQCPFSPARIPDYRYAKWSRVRGYACEIGAGGYGQIYMISPGYRSDLGWLYYMDKNNEWQYANFDSPVSAVSVDNNGNPWVINLEGRIFREDANGWREISIMVEVNPFEPMELAPAQDVGIGTPNDHALVHDMTIPPQQNPANGIMSHYCILPLAWM